ncbi:N-acetyltransferase [uncultured Desulfosarcina sp.]|uniref:GNAT family N-acetyltransferase n=1 Tax=uncultured Desulfosarcina sp. TaxID=218289 RepID=UPI0029C72F98|nr:N-acetyltransferase [uncultured Desulfosarcina sp.]
MKLSAYKKSDQSEIQQLFTKTFSDSEGRSEGALIGQLVLDLMNETEPYDIFGFVATENEKIIGSIFFTRLSFDAPVEAFLLSPVAVHTNHQGKGVGQRLIDFGIDRLKEEGVKLVFTYGDPNFYSKAGFGLISEDTAKAPFELTQPEGWLCQSLDGGEIGPLTGVPRCVKALNKPEYW